jgi:hypothetical protein
VHVRVAGGLMRLGKWLYTIPLGLYSLFGREQVEKDQRPTLLCT